MNKKVAGALILVLLGVTLILLIKFLGPMVMDWKQKSTSDAKDMKGSITLAMDNFAGYYPLCSKEMKRRIRAEGYALKCVDDKADYVSRMKQLAAKEIDFAVATVDSFILNDVLNKYSGVIIAGVDESKGVDGVAAWDIKNLDELKSRRGNYKIAFTPASPSDHLLKAVGAHFDIPDLLNKRGSWRVEADGSSDALKKFLKKEVSIAVLWEPDLSRALAEKGAVKIISTEDTKNLIVDILLANRDYAEANPEMVTLMLDNYFKTLKHYRDNPNELKEELADQTNLSEEQVEKMLKGIEWMTLEDNARKWFGIGSQGSTSQGMVDTIESTVSILIDSGDFKKNPLPDGDPYRLINSDFIEELYKKNAAGQFGSSQAGLPAKPEPDSLTKKFSALAESKWRFLKEVGTLRVMPITFPSGSSVLGLEGKEELDKAVKNLVHYPNYRAVIEGHTSNKGDPAENKKLSQARADAVKRYLMVTHGIDENRLMAIGRGGEIPLPQKADEPDRAYNYRLLRVELHLMSETL